MFSFKPFSLLFLVFFSFNLAAELNPVWFGAYGSADNEEATASCFDSAGNFYTAGNFKSNLTIGSQALSSGIHTVIFVAKYNSTGQFIWAKQSSGSGANVCTAYIKSIAADTDGNLFICGKFKEKMNLGSTLLSSQSNSDDIFVAKINSAGTFLWSKRAGNSGDEVANNICLGTDSNPVLSGNYTGTVDFFGTPAISNGGTDMFIAKLDSSDGTLIQLSSFGGNGQDSANSLCVIPNVGYALCGTYTDAITFGSFVLNKVGKEAYVCCLDNNLTPLWAKSSEGTGVQNGDTICASNSSIFIGGRYTSLVNFDNSIPALPNVGDALFAAKLNFSGIFDWVKSMGQASSSTRCWSSCVTNTSELVLSGSYTSSFTTITSAGSSDGFIVKLHNDGDFNWAQTLGGTGMDVAYSISSNNSGDMLCSGYYSAGNPDFINQTPTNMGLKDIFSILIHETSADIPSAPQNLSIHKTETTMQLTWDAVTVSQTGTPISVSGYNIYYKLDVTSDSCQFLGQVSGTSFILPSQELINDVRFYVVKAYR